MAKPANDKNEPKARDFETILGRLKQIVADLEGGDSNLEQSLALFEEGVGLSREGHAILDDAEGRVQTLLDSGEIVDGIEGSED
jgi:exodeoxyribonuclease VII small subunit